MASRAMAIWCGQVACLARGLGTCNCDLTMYNPPPVSPLFCMNIQQPMAAGREDNRCQGPKQHFLRTDSL